MCLACCPRTSNRPIRLFTGRLSHCFCCIAASQIAVSALSRSKVCFSVPGTMMCLYCSLNWWGRRVQYYIYILLQSHRGQFPCLFIHVDFRIHLLSFTRTRRLTCGHRTFSPRHTTAPIRTFTWHFVCLCKKFLILKMFHLVTFLCIYWYWGFWPVPEVHLCQGILTLRLLRGALQFWGMLGTSCQARPSVALPTLMGGQRGSFSTWSQFVHWTFVWLSRISDILLLSNFSHRSFLMLFQQL